ncbi:hypothetical protein QQX98_005343 [Neonectria punicea]|uniref:Methylated-DNA--protein-cysteine methyltransferase n=1 Tax=Neonectria punicea TaxID=979145 RepID=A0ABR1H5N0_9HYPO
MTAGVKRPLEDPAEEVRSKISKSNPPDSQPTTPSEPIPSHFHPSMHSQLARIASAQRTPFEKRVWTALCQIPPGHFTTYGLLAAHLDSSPRAVGNALRRNPFAPEVPCHRVVATGGALGGFKGKWPRDGEGITIDEKKKLLRGEGVRLDGKGKVIGTPFRGFV